MEIMIYLTVANLPSPHLDCSNVAHWVGWEVWGWRGSLFGFSPNSATCYEHMLSLQRGRSESCPSPSDLPPCLRLEMLSEQGPSSGCPAPMRNALSSTFSKAPQLKFLVQERSQWIELGLEETALQTLHRGCQALTEPSSSCLTVPLTEPSSSCLTVPLTEPSSSCLTVEDVGLSCSLSLTPPGHCSEVHALSCWFTRAENPFIRGSPPPPLLTSASLRYITYNQMHSF